MQWGFVSLRTLVMSTVKAVAAGVVAMATIVADDVAVRDVT